MSDRQTGSSGGKRSLLSGILLFLAGLAAGAGGLVLALALGVQLPLGTDAKASAEGEKQAEAPGDKETQKTQEVELRSMAAELGRERERFEKQRAELEVKAKQLAIEKESLASLKKAIEAVESRLSSQRKETKSENSAVEAQNSKRLGKMWAQMNPPEAAIIAAGLDDNTVAQVLFSMSERQSAPILASMSTAGLEGSKRAAAITARIRTMKDPSLQAQEDNNKVAAKPEAKSEAKP